MGGTGNDYYTGGAGIDTLSYAAATQSVYVDLNLNFTAGVDGLGSSAFAFEDIIGGSVSDTLTGNSLGNYIAGGAGSDRIDGGAGNDYLDGGDGNDMFRFSTASIGSDYIADFSDGADLLSFAAAAATSFANFTIINNGTALVTLTLGTENITLAGAAPITITASDFVFS